MKQITDYSSVIEVVEAFSDEKQNLIYWEKHRWPNGITCPHCWSEHVYRFKDDVRFKCKACRKHFNAKTGSVLEGTKLPLKKWYVAIYLDTVAAKGISSYELARQIKVTQATAWFMLTRIRTGMNEANTKEHQPMDGVIEMDETYVGGKNKNRHTKKKVKYTDTFTEKSIVLGMLNRSGKIKCMVIPNRNSETLFPIIRENIKDGARIMTDEHNGYTSLQYYYTHYTVNHVGKVYVNEDTTTNGVENFWSHLKRSILGVYHNVSKKHLEKYVQSSVFRYNTRTLSSKSKIELLIRHSNARLKLKDLKAI